MKLFEIERGAKIKWDGEVITFHHLDGMYSYCTLENGDVVHLSVLTPVKKINDVYEIDE